MADADQGQIAGTAVARFEISVTDDRLRALFSCGADALGCPNLFQQVQERLKSMRIPFKPHQAVFDAVVERARRMENPRITDLPLVAGSAPGPPTDGRLEWSRNYFDTHYPVDPVTGSIDFKNRVGDPTVSKDDLLVKVTYPKPGLAGVDVHGLTIPARQPRELKLSIGENVHFDEEASGFRAACGGRVSFRNNQLKVDPVYYVRGDVGGTTGNIHHNGPVVITGDVDAGFIVEAAGDIEIHGMIYGARVKCGGSLAIAGGVNANDEGLLEVQGTVTAKFLLNAGVRAGGDVVVEKEIYRCRIEARGEVKIPSGRIVGGDVFSSRGITVGEAGSASDPSTLLALKPDPVIIREQQRIKGAVADAQELCNSLRRTLRDFKKQEASLGDASRKKMADTAAELAQLEKWMAGQAQQIQAITRQIEEGQSALIQILRHIYPGVWLKIYHGDYRTDTEMLGPITARLDRAKGVVALGGEDETTDADAESGEKTAA